MLKIIYIYIYKRSDNRTVNNTSNTYKHINQYSTDVFHNYKVKNNVKKSYLTFLMMLLFISIIPLTLMILTM